MDPIAHYHTMATVFLLPFVVKDTCTYADIKYKPLPTVSYNLEKKKLVYSLVGNKALKWSKAPSATVFSNKYQYKVLELEAPALWDYIQLLLYTRYSDLSDHIKDRILFFWKATPDTLLYRILNGKANTIWKDTESSYGKYNFVLPTIDNY